MTQEIARLFMSAGAISAAANRYSGPKAREPPRRKARRQNGQKWPIYTPLAAISEPAMAMQQPSMKPSLRPNRRISIEAGMVASAVPPTTKVTGRVASALSSARIWPTRPPRVTCRVTAEFDSAMQTVMITTCRMTTAVDSAVMGDRFYVCYLAYYIEKQNLRHHALVQNFVCRGPLALADVEEILGCDLFGNVV